jgi:hypothetical protein
MTYETLTFISGLIPDSDGYISQCSAIICRTTHDPVNGFHVFTTVNTTMQSSGLENLVI